MGFGLSNDIKVIKNKKEKIWNITKTQISSYHQFQKNL